MRDLLLMYANIEHFNYYCRKTTEESFKMHILALEMYFDGTM